MARKYYATNKDLSNEIEWYRQTGEITNKLGKMIQEIADGVAKKSNFYNYSWLEDMKSEAVCRTIRYLHNIDENKNPFSYITQICYNVFVEIINQEKTKSNVKDYLYQYWTTKEKKIEDSKNSERAIDYQKIKL